MEDNNALKTCFWEVKVLQKHFREEIRQLFTDLKNSLANSDYINIKEYKKITDESIL